VRVLYLVHQYLPKHVGGTELYTQSVARALASSGQQADIFYRHHAPGQGLEHRTDEGVELWSAWSGPENPTRRFMATFGDAGIERSFERVLDDIRPDLVHVQHLMGLPTRVIFSIRRRGIPVVVTLHDFWWVCANAQLLTNYGRQICDGPCLWLNCGRCVLARAGAGRLWPAAPLLTPLLAARARRLRAILLGADVLIAPTAFVRDWYTAHDVPPERSQVLPHGIEGPETPVQVSRSGRPVRFACIGGLTWQKGVHVLVDAFNRLKGRAELWIAGDASADPTYAGNLRAAASDGVRFLGPLSRRQVWECLAQVDALIVPSLWYEAFSLIVHEAFAAGVPVVASRLGALAEVVRDGVDGVLVLPGDTDAWRGALQRLVDDPASLNRLRVGVRPPLSMAQHVQCLSDIYKRVVARASGDVLVRS
jgi:glycosyltransferase involved in cell wall biosynthesis